MQRLINMGFRDIAMLVLQNRLERVQRRLFGSYGGSGEFAVEVRPTTYGNPRGAVVIRQGWVLEYARLIARMAPTIHREGIRAFRLALHAKKVRVLDIYRASVPVRTGNLRSSLGTNFPERPPFFSFIYGRYVISSEFRDPSGNRVWFSAYATANYAGFVLRDRWDGIFSDQLEAGLIAGWERYFSLSQVAAVKSFASIRRVQTRRRTNTIRTIDRYVTGRRGGGFSRAIEISVGFDIPGDVFSNPKEWLLATLASHIGDALYDSVALG